MKQTQKEPTYISASAMMFDYLKEKVGERRTKIEAYCDLLDKSMECFASPFVRKSDRKLEPGQCHVTITDLAENWHWHRATVRSFLEHLEDFGQLTIERLPKSIVINMPKNTEEEGCPIDDSYWHVVDNIKSILANWITGEMDDADTGSIIGTMFAETCDAMRHELELDMPDEDGTEPDPNAETRVQQNIERLRLTIFTLIVRYAFCKAVLTFEEDEAAPLHYFFVHDLGCDFLSILEASKALSELTLNGSSSSLNYESKQVNERFQALVEPFKAALAKSMAKDSGEAIDDLPF
jgi:hypothetical protein